MRQRSLLFVFLLAAIAFPVPLRASGVPSSAFLPLAMNAPLPPSPPPTNPQLLPMPPGIPDPEHTLSAFVIDQHPASLITYYFVLVKFRSGNQDGLIIALPPGATESRLVYLIDGNTAQFPGPIAQGNGRLLRNGGIELAFSACAELDPVPPATGCRAYHYFIPNVDMPFDSERAWRAWQRVEVAK